MTKKEIIWRHILWGALEKNKTAFTQKSLAQELHVSTSTIFNALKMPRKLGAVSVTGRSFALRDTEKLLLLWASHRNLARDIVYATRVPHSIRNVESSMPPGVLFGAFSAYRLKYHEAPADYSIVYVYSYSNDVETIRHRFPPQKGNPNLFVVHADPLLASFGNVTPDVQTFVDLWNVSAWYAKDFVNALKQKLHL